ncbi:MAG: DUF493 family protein [Deltaproteobacteria bacterium]|nr:DUF493 family protein [Deltaproteobacteria bacterium]
MVLNSPKVRHLRYEQLRKSLTETVEKWPHFYEHKIIGKNAETFKEGLKNFEQQFPRMNKKSSHLSKNGTYLSQTYEVMARDVDEIISLWVASEEIPDFVTVL